MIGAQRVGRVGSQERAQRVAVVDREDAEASRPVAQLIEAHRRVVTVQVVGTTGSDQAPASQSASIAV